MKKVIVLAGLLLTACAQLKHGDLQPVTVKSLKESSKMS